MQDNVRNIVYIGKEDICNITDPHLGLTRIVSGGLTYTYDTAGRRTAMSAGNGTATFANAACTYDAMGRIATVGNSFSYGLHDYH